MRIDELEAAIRGLSPTEVEQFSEWYENFIEDRLQLTDKVKAALDQSRQEIAVGNYVARQTD